jgi:hypothetical protein
MVSREFLTASGGGGAPSLTLPRVAGEGTGERRRPALTFRGLRGKTGERRRPALTFRGLRGRTGKRRRPALTFRGLRGRTGERRRLTLTFRGLRGRTGERRRPALTFRDFAGEGTGERRELLLVPSRACGEGDESECDERSFSFPPPRAGEGREGAEDVNEDAEGRHRRLRTSDPQSTTARVETLIECLADNRGD